MPTDTHVADIAHIIQLAVAPVFLLSGVGVTLTVLTNRLSRIVDRARVLEERVAGATETLRTALNADLRTLASRARYINWAITLTTCSGLLVCLVIVSLFVGYFLSLDLSKTIALLFIVAILAFVVAFVSFLREIFLATSSLRIGPY